MKNLYDLRVVAVLNEYQVVVNAGSSDDVKPGMNFLVFGLGPEIIDPQTNTSLGKLEQVRGRVQVDHIQDNMFIASSGNPSAIRQALVGTNLLVGTPGGPQPLIGPKVGDIVRRLS